MPKKSAAARFMLCVNNDGFPASLELRKVYQAIPDPEAESHRMVRIIDESGEDYLYPANFFVAIELPLAARKALAKAS
jgi:Ca2+-binding EF-hand superfamily protein